MEREKERMHRWRERYYRVGRQEYQPKVEENN